MPRSSSGTRTPKSKNKHAPQALADPPKHSAAFSHARTCPSSNSLADADDGHDDVQNSFRHLSHPDEHDVVVDEHRHHRHSFPAQPPCPGSDSTSALPLPVIAQRRHKSSLTSPPSGSPSSLSELRSSPQKPPLQPSPQQHRLSRSGVASSPVQSVETVPLSQHGGPFPNNAVGIATPTERRADSSTQRVQRGAPQQFPGAAPNALARRSSPATGVSPPPVNFSLGSGSPTKPHASSPIPHALTSPPPQLALQRTASRTRPIIGGSFASSPCGTPQPAGLPAADATPQSTATPNRTPAAVAGSPSAQRTSVPYPSLHSRASSQDSTHAADANTATTTTPTAAAAAVVGAADDDQRDLLVEQIIQDPHKMGQSNAACGRANPPREASHSRSSQKENDEERRDGDREGGQTTHDGARRPPTPSAATKETTRTNSRRGRRTPPPSASPAEHANALERVDTRATPLPSPATNALAEVDDAHWDFQRPPNNQRTFYFKEDNLEFSSQFDSGNLIQVERVGPFQYRMYTAMDCGNAPWQTNNRQWFHFSLRGGAKGVLVTFTFVGMMHSNMFNFDWMPVSAVTPSRPDYVRVPGKAKVEALELMPETPGYPLLVHKSVSKDDADSDDDDNDNDIGNNNNNNNNNNSGSNNTNNASGNATTTGGGVAFSITATGKSGAAGGKKKKAKKKKCIAMNLTFDYKIEAEVPVTHTPPKGLPNITAIYLASNHPYTYSRLQRNLVAWQEAARKGNTTRSHSVQAAQRANSPPRTRTGEDAMEARGAQTPTGTHLGGKSTDQQDSTADVTTSAAATAAAAESSAGIYFHREVLCKTHEGHDVTLLTISDRSRMTMQRAPLISEADAIPHSSAHRTTERPFAFTGKNYVVLTARVHPGECPGSHLMHGCIEFLMSRTDMRAAALRHNFVFYIIPMLNPDGVVRGHSRVDANGVDLNRMYRAPSKKRHPAPYCVMALLRSLGDRVSLFVDMHAHANKRGTFFYGNSMDGAEQVENLLYARLVSLNTPYLDFRSCNFSEANMFAVGKSGKGKDSSSRVVVFTDAGIVHGYTIEASHVMAEALNPVVTLVNSRGEEMEKSLPTPLQLAHTPATFADTGRAMLVALLDLHSLNPLSRLSFTPYHSTRGVSMWLQRQLQIETAEMLFAQAFKAHGKEVQASSHESGNNLLGPMLRSLTRDEYPEKITLKKARLLPRTTYSGVRQFLPIETAVALLSQTAPTGPPRSLLYNNNSNGNNNNSNNGVNGSGNVRRRGASPATGAVSTTPPAATATAAAAAAAAAASPTLPAVIATKRRPRAGGAEADLAVES